MFYQKTPLYRWEKEGKVNKVTYSWLRVLLAFDKKKTKSKSRQEELELVATMIVLDNNNMPPTAVLKPGLRPFVKVV